MSLGAYSRRCRISRPVETSVKSSQGPTAEDGAGEKNYAIAWRAVFLDTSRPLLAI